MKRGRKVVIKEAQLWDEFEAERGGGIVNLDSIQNLMRTRGWSEVMLAKYIGIDYSYCYRVLRGKRGVGGKFIIGLLRLCIKYNLDIKDFFLLEEK